MQKYAKIINEKTKACQVGTGTNEGLYKSIGMRLFHVEQAWDGQWYIEGYAPAKPQELINQERIAELKRLLASTDYVATKIAEVSGEQREAIIERYAEMLRQRQAWRDEINALETQTV